MPYHLPNKLVWQHNDLLQDYRTVKTIMPNTMYAQYQHQDIPLLNILFISEFNGLNTLPSNITL